MHFPLLPFVSRAQMAQVPPPEEHTGRVASLNLEDHRHRSPSFWINVEDSFHSPFHTPSLSPSNADYWLSLCLLSEAFQVIIKLTHGGLLCTFLCDITKNLLRLLNSRRVQIWYYVVNISWDSILSTWGAIIMIVFAFCFVHDDQLWSILEQQH